MNMGIFNVMIRMVNQSTSKTYFLLVQRNKHTRIFFNRNCTTPINKRAVPNKPQRLRSEMKCGGRGGFRSRLESGSQELRVDRKRGAWFSRGRQGGNLQDNTGKFGGIFQTRRAKKCHLVCHPRLLRPWVHQPSSLSVPGFSPS